VKKEKYDGNEEEKCEGVNYKEGANNRRKLMVTKKKKKEDEEAEIREIK